MFDKGQLHTWMDRIAEGDLWGVAADLEALPTEGDAPDVTLASFRRMVAELVRSREAFDDYNRGLERAVLEEIEGERDRALVAEARATAASRAKTRFLANVSHELRTPLNVILGYTELLIEDIEDPGPAEDLRRVLSASQHLLRLIDDVLDVSRIESGHEQVYLEEVDVAGLAADVIDAMAPLAETNHNHLQLDISPALGTIVTDEQKVRQTLLNIVGNACKFTHRGSITLTCRRRGDWVRLAVKDTGVGMTEEQAEVAFEEFAQVGPSIGRAHGGAGLGLAISRRLCQLLGGDLTVHSELGVGSEFTIVLPVMARDAADEGTEPRTDHAELARTPG